MSKFKLTQIPIHVLVDLQEELTDKEILAMSPKELFTAYLEWNGIQGYSHDFWTAVTELHKLESKEK